MDDDIILEPLPKSQHVKYQLNEKPLDLDEFIAMACMRFRCDCKVNVKRGIQSVSHEKISKHDSPSKYKKIILTPHSEKETEESASRTTIMVDTNTITITALYDSLNRLAEIVLHNTRVPRILLQIVSLIVPHYPQLAKIVIKQCRIGAYTIYEMSKFLSLTTIAEICLDGSPIPEANYALLLQNQSKLSSLSLSRCNINDDVCKQIASKLQFLEPAEATLSTLNLSSNHITDAGAKHLGEALRTNRHLRYLNLADNWVGDVGANHIFHALIDFPLTYDQTKAKKRRYMTYLRAKQAVDLKNLTDCGSRSLNGINTINNKSAKKPTPISTKNKAKKDKTNSEFMNAGTDMTTNDLGVITDPFEPSSIRYVDGVYHCVGNMVLCYLNLCYNHLSYLSLKELQAGLLYQSVSKKPNQTGLMKVLVQGNNLPSACSEIERIKQLLQRNVVNFSPKASIQQNARGRAL